MAQAFAFNVAIGGTIAAFRAHIAGRNAWSAFKTGAVGGGVHFLGKEIGVGRWAPSGVLGSVVAATGTSIIANASEGRAAFSELSVPVSAVRLRFTPAAQSKFHASLNVFYAGLLVRDAIRPGLRFQWGHSAYAASPVFLTDKRIKMGDVFPGGITDGSNVVITTTLYDATEDEVLRHEATHVRQLFLFEETIGLPLERRLRQVIPGARRIPAWLELGFLPVAASALDQLSPKRQPLYRWLDGEAEMFERR